MNEFICERCKCRTLGTGILIVGAAGFHCKPCADAASEAIGADIGHDPAIGESKTSYAAQVAANSSPADAPPKTPNEKAYREAAGRASSPESMQYFPCQKCGRPALLFHQGGANSVIVLCIECLDSVVSNAPSVFVDSYPLPKPSGFVNICPPPVTFDSVAKSLSEVRKCDTEMQSKLTFNSVARAHAHTVYGGRVSPVERFRDDLDEMVVILRQNGYIVEKKTDG